MKDGVESGVLVRGAPRRRIPERARSRQRSCCSRRWSRRSAGTEGNRRRLPEDNGTARRQYRSYARALYPRMSGGIACRTAESASIAGIVQRARRSTSWSGTTSGLSLARSTTGRSPRESRKHAREELLAYLDCGLLCRGFRPTEVPPVQRNPARGVPSCMGRRMCATAVNLIERVLPP
jgi:hypothetical protein